MSDDVGVTVDSVYDDPDRLSDRRWSGGGIDPARIDFAYNARSERTGAFRYSDLAATPPHFLDAPKFQRWLDHQNVDLLEVNNELPSTQKVILVHLRRPRLGNAEEMRTYPLWEFGSFGCTGCHARNLMNPRRADELAGAQQQRDLRNRMR